MTFEGRGSQRQLARKQREERLRRYLIIGLAIVAVSVIGVLGYGWYDINVRQPNRAVITVEGEQISQQSFRARIRLLQNQLINQINNSQQLFSFFGDNPDVRAQLEQDVARMQAQLQNPTTLGQQTIEQMVQEVLIRQEAERRGITVTEEEVDEVIQESFGFYLRGTPTAQPSNTPRPTGTIDPTVQAASSPTASPTLGPTPTSSLTPTPLPTSTPYTQELYEQDYLAYMDQLAVDEIREVDFRDVVRAELYRQKLRDAFEEETPRVQEQVQARHILVEEESTAQEVLSRLDEGEEFEALAAEYSLDESNKDSGGDLGWFGRGRMVEPFEEAAFDGEVGEIVGPVETSFGFHIIEVLGHEERELSEQEFQTAVDIALQQWLSEARGGAQVDVLDQWPRLVPPPPGISPLN